MDGDHVLRELLEDGTELVGEGLLGRSEEAVGLGAGTVRQRSFKDVFVLFHVVADFAEACEMGSCQFLKTSARQAFEKTPDTSTTASKEQALTEQPEYQ